MKRISTWVMLALLSACSDDQTQHDPDAQDSDAILVGQDSWLPDTTTPDTQSQLCDPVAQTGCHPTEQCTYVAANRTPSCFAKGSVPVGEACSQSERCELGVCISVNSTEAHCFKICNQDSDCPGTPCQDTTFGAYRICENRKVYTSCDLLGDPCDSEDGVERGCYAVLEYDTAVCLPAGLAQEGQSCGAANECAAGLACRFDVCRQLCDLDGQDSCPAGQSCKEYRFEAGACLPDNP